MPIDGAYSVATSVFDPSRLSLIALLFAPCFLGASSFTCFTALVGVCGGCTKCGHTLLLPGYHPGESYVVYGESATKLTRTDEWN